MSNNDLRWLTYNGVVEAAIEVTEPGEAVRTFRPSASALFSERTCFVLAQGARARALVLSSESSNADTPRNGHERALTELHPVAAADHVPVWDRDLQELRWEGQVVKQFKAPSPNQETILAAFEEEHWPTRIDDPLPPVRDQDPKRRLHDTINSLNRNQKNSLTGPRPTGLQST
jgi:hypothetical protein